MSDRPYNLVRHDARGQPYRSDAYESADQAKRIWKMLIDTDTARGIAVIYGPNGFCERCDNYHGAEWKPGDGKHKPIPKRAETMT